MRCGTAEHGGMGLKGGVGYPSDVTDEELAFVLPYLLLCREDSRQRKHQGDREQVAALAEEVQQVTGNNVELAYVDQGYTGSNAAEAAEQHRLRLEVVKHPMAKRGFVLLPRRWVVERSFTWAARFRRLARDYEGLHLLAFATLMLRNLLGTLK